MGLFGSKVKHQPMGAIAAYEQAFGLGQPGRLGWSAWIPKFPIKGNRDQCFVGRLVLVDGQAHLELDGVDYGPVNYDANDALDAIAQYGGESCPAVMRITKPTARNFSISVVKKQAQ